MPRPIIVVYATTERSRMRHLSRLFTFWIHTRHDDDTHKKNSGINFDVYIVVDSSILIGGMFHNIAQGINPEIFDIIDHGRTRHKS